MFVVLVCKSLGLARPMTSCLATILEDGGAELRGTPLEASTTRILVVDDFEPWRRYVSTALQTNPKLEIIGEALDGLEAVLKTPTTTTRPDLAGHRTSETEWNRSLQANPRAFPQVQNSLCKRRALS